MVAIVSGNGLGLLNGSAGMLGQQGTFGNATFGATKEGAYLNVFNGNLTLQDTDGFLANTGLNLAYTRTYNSQGTFGGGRARSWSDGLARLVGAPPSGASTAAVSSLVPFTRIAGDGSVSKFAYDATRGAYVSTDGGGAYQTIRWSTTDNQWHWTDGRDDDKEAYEAYDATGRLVTAGDAAGARNRYTYDTAGRLATITSGSTISTYKYGLLNSASNTRTTTITQNSRDGSTIRTAYETDALDRLVRVVTDLTPASAGDALTYAVDYTYDGNSDRIASVVQADGSAIAVTYEGDKVRSITEHDNSGIRDRVMTFAYSTIGANAVTTVSNGLGHLTTYTADAQGRLLTVAGSQTDEVPLKLTFTYDAVRNNGDVQSVTDAAGRTTWFEYDSHGNNILQRDADGNTISRTFRLLDPTNPARGYTNELLTETVYAVRDPDGAGTGKAGKPLTSRNVFYTAAGSTHLVRYKITPQGRVTEYAYNADGECTGERTYMDKAYDTANVAANVAVTEGQVLDWVSNSGVTGGQVKYVDYSYTLGRVASETRYSSGATRVGTRTDIATVSHSYDNAGNLRSSVDAKGTATTYLYDGLGRITTRTDPSGTTTYTYLPNSTATSTVESTGITTLRIYDSSGRLLSATQSQNGLSTVTRNVYDAAGRLCMTIAPGDRKTVWLYDGSGRKTAQVGPDGAITEYIYTGDSGTQPARVIQYANTVDTSSLFTDGALRTGLRVADIRPRSTAFDRTSWQRYDALGRIIASVDPEGFLSRFEYDGAGRLVGTIRRAERVAEARLAEGITWEAAADVVSVEDRRTRAFYNADGLVTAKIDALGYLTEYVYDLAGQLTDTIRYAAPALRPAVANSVADLRPAGDGAIRERTFYDGLGRVAATVDGDGYVTEMLYDPNGNMVLRTRYATPSSQPAAATLALVTVGTSASDANNRLTSYSYNALNQLESETDGFNTTTYTYDRFGNVLTAKRAGGGTASRTYDTLGRIVSESPAAGIPPITYTYNSAGLRSSMTDGNGNKTVYLYDEAGRIKFTVNAAGEILQQNYDAFGHIATVRQYAKRVSGITESTRPSDLALRLATPQQFVTDTVTQYFYDKNGQLRYTVDGSGGVSETQYTAFGQTAASLRYTGKAAVELNANLPVTGASAATQLSALIQLGANSPTVVTRFNYDAAGRVRYSVNGAADTETYKYDAFGRVTDHRSGSSVQTYSYDGRGNATSYTDGQGAVTTSTYNAFGQATTRSHSGPAVAGSASLVSSVIERNIYNTNGLLVGTVDAAGTLTTLTYDNDGNVVRRLRYATALGAAQIAALNATYIYNVIKEQPGKDADIRYLYEGGRLQSSVTGVYGVHWEVTTFQYDGVGNVTGQRSFAKRTTEKPFAASIMEWAKNSNNASASDSFRITVYDAAGRPEITATLQGVDRKLNKWSITTLTYDTAGRILQRREHAAPLLVAEPSTAQLRGMSTGDQDAITRYQYDAAGRVVAVAKLQSKSGDTMLWSVTGNEYDGAGNVTKSTQYGLAQAFALGSDLLASAVGNPSYDRVTRYAYDRANRLASTVDAMGTATSYQYDTRGNLVLTRVHATPVGATETLLKESSLDRVTRVAYDGNGRVRFEIAPNGAVTEHRYDALGNVTAFVRYATPLLSLPAAASADTVAGLVKPSSADRVERRVYDEVGRLRFTVDAAGYFVEQRYDALGNRLCTLSYVTPIVSADGSLVSMLLASSSAQTAAADAALRPRVTSYSYDAQGRVLSTTDARQHTEIYSYDALGRRVALTNKLGDRWQYRYDAAGRLLEEETPSVTTVSANGLTTIDNAAALSGTTTTLVTTYTYDALGNLLTRSEGEKGSPAPRTTSYRYDLVGRQTETWLPAVKVYDPAADTTATRSERKEKDASDLHVTVTYDALGNAIRNVDAAGNITYKTYDLSGRVAYQTDALNYVTYYDRNAFGEVKDLVRYAERLSNIDPRTTGTMATVVARRKNAAADRIIHTEYDQLGRAIKVTEPASSFFDSHSTTGSPALTAARTTTSRYTAFGEVAERRVFGESGDGKAVTEAASTLYYYDQRGDKRGQVDIVAMSPAPAGYLTTFDYDAAGRLKTSTEWSTVIGAWSNADPFWTGTSVSRPASTPSDRITIYEYDANGNKIGERRVGAAVDATTKYVYDDLDRLNTTTDASGASNLIWYDKLGRTVGTARAKSDSAVNMYTEFRLDAYGNVAVRIDYANGISAGTSAAAPAPTRDPARDRVTATKYDAAGRAATVIDAENGVTNYSHDALGRVAKQWRVLTKGVPVAETAYTLTRYDALGQVSDVIRPGNIDLLAAAGTVPSETVVHTEYNGFGEATARTTREGGIALRTEFTRYDNAGHAWLSNAGDGVYKVTLFDVQGNATASLVSDTAGALAGLANASDALARSDIRRTDTRYDLLGHVVDVSSPHANQLTFLHRQPDDTWTTAAFDPVSKELDGLMVLGDRAEYTSMTEAQKNLSTYSVSYRIQGTSAWHEGPQRVQRIDGYPVFNTAGLAEGTYEFRIIVQPASGDKYELDGGLLPITAQASDQKMLQLIKLYSTVLGRAPDPQGLSFYLGNLAAGFTLAQIATQLLDSNEFAAKASKAAGVAAYLVSNLGISAENPAYTAEVAAWQARMDLKNSFIADNRGQAVVDLLKAKDALLVDQALVLKEYLVNGGGDADTAMQLRNAAKLDRSTALQQAAKAAARERLAPQLSRLFVAILGRAADPVGFTFWRPALEAGTDTPVSVAVKFLDSDEFKSLQPVGSLTPAQFSEQLARRVFRNLMRREPTAAELSAAIPAMGTSSATRGLWIQQLCEKVAGYNGIDAVAQADRATAYSRAAIGLAYAQMTPSSSDIRTAIAVGHALLDEASGEPSIQIIAGKLRAKIAAQQLAAVDTRLAASGTPLETAQVQVARLYTAILNRAPDHNGYNFWVDALLAKRTTLEVVANDMLTNGEGAAIYPASLSNADFLRAVYRNAFGMEIDGTALGTWGAKLVNSSRARVAMDMVDAALLGSFPVPAAQRDLFNNKVAVGMTYALQMNGNDSVFARKLLALVTSTDISAAIESAYRPTVQLAAAAAVANARAAVDGAKLIGDAAVAAQRFTQASAAASDLYAQLSINPMAKPLLMAARLYVSVLNRAASGVNLDVDGIVNMATQMANGSTTVQMAQSMLASAEGRALYAGLDDTAFLTKLYWQTMNRQPDSDGFAFWLDVLKKSDRGTAAAGLLNGFIDNRFPNTDPNALSHQASLQFFNAKVGNALNAVGAQAAASAKVADDVLKAALDAQVKANAFVDATAAYNQVLGNAGAIAGMTLVLERLYVGVLKRGSTVATMPDVTGLTFWTRGLKNGVSAASVAQSFIDSAEGKPIYANLLTPRAFVNQIYLNVLGRPLAAGETFWTDQMTNGATRGAIAAGIIDSVVNHTYETAVEYGYRTSFEQRVLDANNALNNASTTPANISKAATAAAEAESALRLANMDLSKKELALAAANALVTINDPGVIAAQQARDYLASPNRDKLLEVLIGFRRSASYTTMVPLLADLDAGRVTIADIVEGWVSPMGDERAFYDGLYRTILGRAPDAEGIEWWVTHNSRTDAGDAAYDFYQTCIKELNGNTAINYAGNISSAKSENNARATALAGTYDAAMAAAANNIAVERERAARDTETARSTRDAAQEKYNDLYTLNEVARLTKTTLSTIANILDKALAVSRAGSARLQSAEYASSLAAQLNPSAASWTISQLNANLAPKVNSAYAITPDGQLSIALAGIAGANLALMVNNVDFGKADQLTRDVVRVAQLYTMLFGATRQPTTVELNSALVQLRDGVPFAAIADTLIWHTPALSGAANAVFIDQLYHNALGRGVDQAGLRFWLEPMTNNAAFTRSKLVVELIDSLTVNSLNADTALFHSKVSQALASICGSTAAEASSPNVRTYIASLASAMRDVAARADLSAQATLTPAARYTLEQTQLYVMLLGRMPEPSALVNGIAARNAGLSQLQAAQNILASEEVQGKLPATLSNSDFITALHVQALGRNPTGEEMNGGLTKLAGNATRAQYVLDLITSTFGYTGGDATVLAGRNRLIATVTDGLNAAASGIENYAATMSETLLSNLDTALAQVAQRYVDGYRPGIDSTTTAAWVMATAPNRMTVDRWGNTLTVADVRNANWVTRSTYDANNQVLTTTVPTTMQGANVVGLTTTNAYDALGHLKTVTEESAGSKRITRYEYDIQGVLKAEFHADGGYITYDNNALGQRIASHQYLNAGKAVNFKYDYDRLGHLVARTSDEVEVYDWTGAQSNSATADTVRYARIVDRYAYDELGRRIATSQGLILRNATTITEERTTATLRYDMGGNVIMTRDAGGMETYRVFDALNQKVREREAVAALNAGQARTKSWQYDGFGRVTVHTDLGGNTTSSKYNGAGQVTHTDTATVATEKRAAAYQRVTYSYETGTGLLLEMKDLDYGDAAMTTAIDDPARNQLTRYSYDRLGNRVSEQTWLLKVDGQPLRAVQNQRMGYDARGRLISISAGVTNAGYQVSYQLDAFGNRTGVSTTFVNDSQNTKIITVNYEYDAMNRETRVTGSTTTKYKEPVVVSQPVGKYEEKREFDYDGNTYTKEFDNAAIAEHKITYDWAGNRATDNAEIYSYDALGRLQTITTGTTQTGYRHYDAAGRVIGALNGADRQLNDYDDGGRLLWQRTLDNKSGNQRSLVNYMYNDFGNLASYKAWAGTATKAQVTTNTYDTLGESRLLTSTTISNEGSTTTKTSLMAYDVNGYMVRVTGENERTLINDRGGRVLEKDQGYERTHTLIVNDEMVGSSSYQFESFSSVHESISSAGAGASNAGVYVVQSDNEKLTTIAKTLWGDERLWHVLAEANGLTEINEPLKTGQQLIIPAKASAIYNGYDTFNPYNASEVIGSTTPEMAMPQPQGPKKGCGVWGQIIMAAVAIAVTALTGIYMQPFNVFLQAGVSAAAGSIASQAVGVAIGAQDKFSWSQVGRSALSAVVTAGVNTGAGQFDSLSFLDGNDWTQVAARAAISNTVTQGLAVATGLQEHFSWHNVAASAAGAAVGSKVGDFLKDSKAFEGLLSGDALNIARSTVTGFAAGTAAAIAHGGKVEVVQVATDAFGNALGSSLAEAINNTEFMQTRALKSTINAERANRGLPPIDSSDSDSMDTISSIVGARGRKTVAGRLDGYREQLTMYGMVADDVNDVIGRLGDSFHRRGNVTAIPEDGMNAFDKAVLTGGNASLAQRVAAFGSTTVDDVLQGSGRLVKSFGETLAANPLARYALEGIDFAAGPAVWAARKVIMEATPIGEMIGQGQGKIIGRFANQFASVGYNADEAIDGGIGGLTLGTMMVSGASGALSRLSGLSNVLAGVRSRLSAMVPDVHVAPFAPELSRGSPIRVANEVPAKVNIHNAVLDQPRIGYGEKGTGSGNKIDPIVDRLVLDASGKRIEVGYPSNPGRPYALQEFPSTPKSHGFPDIVDNYAGDATSFSLKNGATLMQLEGGMNGSIGRFEWIIDPRLGGVSHRMFIPNGTINGIPVKP